MTALDGEVATTASASAFNGGNETAMAASAVETTLKLRAEVCVRVRADSGGCGKDGGMGGSEGEGKGMADCDGCGESCGNGCSKGGGECASIGDSGGNGCSVGGSKGKGKAHLTAMAALAAVATAAARAKVSAWAWAWVTAAATAAALGWEQQLQQRGG
jgi:hypothetical protein